MLEKVIALRGQHSQCFIVELESEHYLQIEALAKIHQRNIISITERQR